MDYRPFVRKHYQKAVEKRAHRFHNEMIRALRTADRVPQFIDNLAHEFDLVQKYRMGKGKKPFKLEHMASLVHDFTETFLVGIKAKADQRGESDIAKYAREHAGDDVKEMENALEGKVEGAFEDMGLIVGETKEITYNKGD